MLLDQALHTLPLNVSEPGGVPESFGKRIAVYFQLGYQLVLVGSDCCENCLWKDECSEFFRLQIEQGGRVVFLLYDVHPWLVLMH